MKTFTLKYAETYSKNEDEKKIYIIHENSKWVEPLIKELEDLQLPYEEWYINQLSLDLSDIPPDGVFYNRMSASSHTRNHRYAVEMTGPIMAWLESHGRKVINNRRALQLEVRKFEQYLALQSLGLYTPRTIAATGGIELLKAATDIGSSPFIFKPNRGGKGTGVQLFSSVNSFKEALESGTLIHSLDGIDLVQQYIEPKEPYITRTEFIGGKFHYAVRVDTSAGFELCPADACQIGDAFCPTDSADQKKSSKPRFEIIEHYSNPDLATYERFLKENGMEVAAIEYIESIDGKRYLYDVNINTNYNTEAESKISSSKRGMRTIAEYLGHKLSDLTVQFSKVKAV
ncbi:MAG: alpha-L-glutamate ligase [Bacteroidetes bacterium]|nr:alpha-L-glutamate ligase [Bacteroidota bacterium]